MAKEKHFKIINTLLAAEDIPANHKATLLDLKDSLIKENDNISIDTLNKYSYLLADIFARIAKYIE